MIITFARQYGSGGRDIGLKLAELLNYRFYDREILELAAENSSIHPDIAKRFDEKPASSLLYSAFMASGGMDERQIPLNQKLALAQFQVIRDLANEGNCIFVGRCADMALQKRSDLLRIYLHAPTEYRLKRIVEEYGVPKELSEKMLKKTDKTRNDYYEFFTQKKWGQSTNFDLTINTSLLGVDGTAERLAAFIKSL